jgi:hypothetical protein
MLFSLIKLSISWCMYVMLIALFECNLLGKKIKLVKDGTSWVMHFLIYCLYISFHDVALISKLYVKWNHNL